MIKKIFLVLLSIFLFFLTSCDTSQNKENELIEFLKEESISNFNELKELVVNNLDNDSIKVSVNDIYNEYLLKLDSLENVSDISKLTKDYKNKMYNQIPINTTELELTNLSLDEKNKICRLLDEYLYRTNLIGIPLSKSYRLNLNSTTYSSWEYFFGENGVNKQTPREEYWDVKTILSNEYFLRGLNLCLDKELFEKYEILNVDSQMDYSNYDYYNYNLEKAKKYFKLALTEFTETNIYKPTPNEPIILNVEIAYGLFTTGNKCEEIHSILKKSIEDAFNSSDVSNGNFLINVSFWKGEHFGQIYSEKLYCGKFDISFDKISGSAVDYNPYKEYLLCSSNIKISNNLTVNWSHDTGSTSYDCIVYNGYKYSYDEILLALNENLNE